MTNAIEYLNADNGIIIAHTEGGMHLWLENAEQVSDAIKKHGLASKVRSSSSMDYADEYGFGTHHAAWDMFISGKNLAK